jgi:hypothetical protein
VAPKTVPGDSVGAVPGDGAPEGEAAAWQSAARPPASSADPEGGTRARIEALLAGEPCAAVSAARDGPRLSLAGRVASPAARERLVDALGAVPGIGEVSAGRLAILPRPHCATLARLAAAGARPPADAGPAPPPALDYAIGERMRFRIEAPGFPAVLQVDYFDGEGRVYHLLPGYLGGAWRLAPDESRMLGADDARPLAAAAPAGTDMLLVVASSEPLFDAHPQVAEPAAAYLPRLEAAIARLRTRPGAALEMAHRPIRIRPAASPPGPRPKEETE